MCDPNDQGLRMLAGSVDDSVAGGEREEYGRQDMQEKNRQIRDGPGVTHAQTFLNVSFLTNATICLLL